MGIGKLVFLLDPLLSTVAYEQGYADVAAPRQRRRVARLSTEHIQKPRHPCDQPTVPISSPTARHGRCVSTQSSMSQAGKAFGCGARNRVNQPSRQRYWRKIVTHAKSVSRACASPLARPLPHIYGQPQRQRCASIATQPAQALWKKTRKKVYKTTRYASQHVQIL